MTENASVHSGLISIIKHKMFQIFISIVIALLLIASLVVPGLAQASGEDNITLSTDKLSLTGGRVELEGLGFTQISAGNSHSLALDQNGNIYSWGRNNYGHLGNGTTTDSNVPVQVKTTGTPMEGKKIVQISAGYSHSLALDQNGIVYGWGGNYNGQLGNGTTTDSNVPVQVKTTGTPMEGKKIVQISAGYYRSLTLDQNGNVYGWGNNDYGELGNGTTTDSNIPVQVKTTGTPMEGKKIVQISAGNSHSFALDQDGNVHGWGYNYYGQLGNGTEDDSNVPVQVKTTGTPMEGKKIVQISAGNSHNSHSLALDQDGNVHGWGYNYYGQLGAGIADSLSNVPVQVKTTGTPMEGKKIVQISAGNSHSLALDQNGNIYSWGRNNYGQLGNGVTTDEKTTYPVSTLLNSLPNITVGGVPATNISRGLNGKLSFTAPPHDTGPYDVVITYPYANRSYTLAGGLTYINTNPGGSNPSPSESEAGGDSNSNVNNNIDNDNPGAPNAGFGEE